MASYLARLHNQTQPHHNQDSSACVISQMQRPLHDNTQHSQQTDIHTLSRIQTHSPRKSATTDPHLRMCGQWDQQNINLLNGNINVTDNTAIGCH